MRNDRVLLSHLLIESIVEEYNVDEGIRDFAKKAAVTAALGTAGAVGAYKVGKALLNKGDSDSEKIYNIKDEVPMTHEEIMSRQAFKESRYNPKAISPRGAKGLTQIMPSALEDYLKATGKKIEDVDLMDIKHSIDIQAQAMKNLYNSTFINKEKEGQTEIVRLAKTLAAYNYGRGNLSNLLNKIKEEGKIDIYKSLDWLDRLPLETSDYVKKILLKKDPKFEREYQKAIKSDKNKEIVSYYKKIQGFK